MTELCGKSRGDLEAFRVWGESLARLANFGASMSALRSYFLARPPGSEGLLRLGCAVVRGFEVCLAAKSIVSRTLLGRDCIGAGCNAFRHQRWLQPAKAGQSWGRAGAELT